MWWIDSAANRVPWGRSAAAPWPTPPPVSRLLARGLVAWLQVSPAVAAARLEAGLADEPRPMLNGDPRRRLVDLITTREAAYRQAHVHIDTDDRSVAEIAEMLTAEVRAAHGCRPA